MVTGQIIYNWFLIRHVLYISMIYLSLLIHILVATRIHIKKGKSKKHLPTSLFLPKRLCLQGFSRGRCMAKRSLNTSPNTSLIFILHLLFFWTRHFQESDEGEKTREKVTCWVRCWVRCLANTSLSETLVNKGVLDKKSEMVRSFLKFSPKIRKLYPQGHLLSYGVYAYKKKEVCCNYL